MVYRYLIQGTAWSECYLIRINVLNKSLQRGHPARRQMTILEEDPLASIHGAPHHGLSTRTLRAHTQDGFIFFKYDGGTATGEIKHEK